MSESGVGEIAITEVVDPNKLEIETIRLGKVDVTLLSCDHIASKMPKEDPWPKIKEEIKKSSLVFVEYFPWELKSRLYNNPVWGKLGEKVGNYRGINSFFSIVSDICVQENKQIAVSDIATDGTYSLYHSTSRYFPGLAAASAVSLVIPENIMLAPFEAYLYSMVANSQELFEKGMFSKNRQRIEKIMLDIEDARRLLTARGIAQEATRRTSESKFTYIAPHAHVNRIKWYLENPDDISTKVKSKIYNLAVGLPKSTRIYKPIENYSWQLISDIPTKV